MKKKTARSVSRVKKSVSSNVIRLKEEKNLYNEEVKGFVVHVMLYLLINLGLYIYLSYFNMNGGDITLFYWVFAGWGVGLIAHALAAFGVLRFLDKELKA